VLRRQRRQPPPRGLVGDHADVLSRVPAVHADPDERPNHEDRALPPVLVRFTFPVELPRLLRPRRRRR